MWRIRRGEGPPPSHSHRPDLSTIHQTFLVIPPWMSQAPPKQPGVPNLLLLLGSYLRESTTFHQKSDPDPWSRPPCSSNHQALQCPFSSAPALAPPPHHQSSCLVPPYAFPKPDLEPLPHAMVKSSTLAGVWPSGPQSLPDALRAHAPHPVRTQPAALSSCLGGNAMSPACKGRHPLAGRGQRQLCPQAQPLLSVTAWP